MADEVQGLVAEVTVDLAGLQSGLDRAGQYLRAFDQKWGHLSVQIATQFVEPNAQAAAQLQRGAKGQLDRLGAMGVPINLGQPTRQQTEAFRSALERNLGVAEIATRYRDPATGRFTTALAAQGITLPAVAPTQPVPVAASPRQPTTATEAAPLVAAALKRDDARLAATIDRAASVSGTQTRPEPPAPGSVVAAAVPTEPIQRLVPGNVEAKRVQAQERANRTGSSGQYINEAGAIVRVQPQRAGVELGSTRAESVGGFGLPPVGGPRAFTGTVGPNGENLPRILEDLATKDRRISELEAQIGQRSAARVEQAQRQLRIPAGLPGAGGFATPAQITEAQAAVTEGRVEGRRILPRQFAPVAPTLPTPQAAAAQVLSREQQERAELMAGYAAAYGTSTRSIAGLTTEDLRARTRAIAETPEFQGGVERLREQQERQAQISLRGAPRILPEERERILAAQPELQQAEETRRALAGTQFQAAQGLPTSQRIAFARLFGRAIGGQDLNELRREAGTSARELDRQLSLSVEATQKVEVAQKAYDEAVRAGSSDVGRYERALGAAKEGQARATEGLKEAKAAAETADAALKDFHPTIRGFAASFAGGVAGGLAFGAAMQAATSGIDLLSKAGSKGVDVLTGYIGISQKVTDALSDQTRAAHGLVDIATAAAFTQSGISEGVANTIRPLIEQRTSLEAGSKAFADQIDQIKTYVNLQQAIQQGGPIPGISTGTGGVLGTPLFQTPGLIEQLSQLTPAGQAQEAGGVIGGVGGALAGAGLGFLTAGPIGAIVGAGIGGFAGFEGGRTVGGLLPNPTDLGPAPLGVPGPQFTAEAQAGFTPQAVGEIKSAKDQVAQLTPQMAGFKLAVDDLNEAAQRGSPNVKALGQAVYGLDESSAAVQQTAQILQGLKVDPSQIANLSKAGFALQGIAGVGDISNQLKRAEDFFTAAGRGASLPSSQEFLAQLRTQELPARQFQTQAQLALQRQTTAAQLGIQYAAQPLLPFGATIPGGLGAVSPQLRSLIGPSQGIDRIQVQQIQAAALQIQNLTQPLGPVAQAQAGADFSRIQTLGAQGAAIQTAVAQEQANYQVAQFNEQLRIAQRSELDLEQITGRIGATQGDNLGILERQTIVYQRQTAELQLQSQQLQNQGQALSLALSQRQINFQVAVAGFAAAGTSPEEIAARRNEAQYEASVAQKQLDIQKQQLALAQRATQIQAANIPIQFKIQDIGFQRQLTDIEHQIALINQGIRVTVDTAAAQEAMQRIQAEIGRTTADLNSLLQAGASLVSAAIGDEAKYIAQFTSDTHTLEQSAADFLTGIGSSYAASIVTFLQKVAAGTSAVTSSIAQGNYLQPRGTGTSVTGAQTGYLGNVSNETQFVAGEAGTEAVAVLAQPRDVTVHPKGPMEMTVGMAKGQTVGIVRNPPRFADGFAGYVGQDIVGVPRYAGGMVAGVPSSMLSSSSVSSDHANDRTTLINQSHVEVRNVDHYADGWLGLRSSAPGLGISHLSGKIDSQPTQYLGGFQAGGIMNVSGRSAMTIGEAGPETVAVLRNPRQMDGSAFTGGGAITIHITFAGPITVGSRDDLEEMTQKISQKAREALVQVLAPPVARQVDQMQSRRSSLLGFRAPSPPG